MKQKLLMSPLLPKSKKGQMQTLMVVKSTILVLVTIIVVAIAGILVAVSLRDAGIFDAGSQEENDTNDMINNYSAGVTSFFANIPTIFTILFVVVIIGFIALVIVIVNRFGGVGNAGL